MKVIIATKNKAKINAVKEALFQYKLFSDVSMKEKEVDSGVSDQPKSLKETIKGAKNRAKKSFNNCDLSIGIESGLMKIEDSFFDVTVATFFDGKNFSLGLSPSWQCPQKTIDLMKNQGLNMTQAAYKCGLSSKNNLGAQEGLIGVLSKKRVTRKDYTKQAIYMALIPIENKELYG